MSDGSGKDPPVWWTAATRYLCVGAQLDEEFARRVLHELLVEKHRAVAPSYGIDLVPIVVHCLRAERRRTVRDGLLVAVLVGLLALAPLVVGGLLFVGAVSRVIYRNAQKSKNVAKRRNAGATAGLFALGVLVVAALLPYRLGFGEGTAVASVPALLRSHADPPVVIVGLLGALPVSALCGYLTWLRGRTYAGRELRAPERRTWSEMMALAPSTLSTQRDDRLVQIGNSQYRKTVVYSPLLRSPFVGAGLSDAPWSFAVNLTQAANPSGDPPARFTASELQAAIAQRIGQRAPTGEGRFPSDPPPESDISDRWFVDGVSQGEGGGPGLPVTPRHFKCIQVRSWGGEVVRSVFLHTVIEMDTLYVEFSACLLPPILPAYHIVDPYPQPAPLEKKRALHAALAGAPWALLDAPANLASRFRNEMTDEERARRKGKVLVLHDRGARLSVRELGAADEPDYYFQRLDAYKHLKIIELRVLDAIVDFLDQHHVNTRQFRAQRTQILQNSVFNFGDVHNQVNAQGAESQGTIGDSS
jgi:hypothetical protein